MIHELANSVIGGHPEPTGFYRGICSRRLYYQRLLLKRLITHHRQMHPLPEGLEVELEVYDVE